MIHFSRPLLTHGMRGHVLLVSLLLGQIRDAGAHGHLTWPPSSRHGGNIHHGADCGDGSCFWFSNNVEVTTQTLPSAHRTMEPEVTGGVDVWRKNPWRSPGAAPVYGSGCGVAGGHSTNVYANGGTPPAGVTLGFDGKNLPKTNLGPAKWQVGSVVEVAWAMAANHGGGYAYRLCRADGVVNEACFQSGHLEFSGSDSAHPVPERHPRRRPSSRDRRRYHPRGIAVGEGRHTHLPYMRARVRHVRRALVPGPRSRLRQLVEQAGELLRRLRGGDELESIRGLSRGFVRTAV